MPAAAFENFTDDNDPYFEHDFGNFELDGETIFWKIDLYEGTAVKHYFIAKPLFSFSIASPDYPGVSAPLLIAAMDR